MRNTWEEIVVEFEAWANMSCKPVNMKKYRTGDVIDEDMSVRWNKEEIIRRNAVYEQEVSRLNTERNKARDVVYEHIYAYIIDEVGYECTKKKAMAIWSMAYEHGHSYGMHEIKIYLDELIELAQTLMA